MDLPSIIPVFALPNVVLFPGVPLPLHIFETRYRDMVREATAGHELIGMALLSGDWQKHYDDKPDIFPVGCAGKIVNVEPLPDGRCNILLHGQREFTIRRHIFDKPYREAEVVWRARTHAVLATARRAALTQLLGRFLSTDIASPANRLLHNQSLSDDMLVNFFSYALPLEPLERQGLLEADGIEARAQRLCEILEFRLEEQRLTLKRPGPDRCH